MVAVVEGSGLGRVRSVVSSMVGWDQIREKGPSAVIRNPAEQGAPTQGSQVKHGGVGSEVYTVPP